ncbi:MAG: SDR family NAD(P)-dependent oxidoreductase [Xanthomonadales bacterium]|nr:SDR family NAD(P)-dependent oxidoreductase [Xanthomonadales bacterium]NIN59957.1 SDR family NAD(P)-dependent oxidoreductase [Xanthomonadales bacterium]NIN75331.1 SDR family NAD(P)-dependent oxidoreductase [Xanthomonadales bacterium]NIO13500.1 SDR family NAD(P)-dependent oxidoreductase [Xanthomonadales bacterium]NIP12350.1 SDR family NAD(P)-dependent oxidoreductase [Xanthomonadales bacterium]
MQLNQVKAIITGGVSGLGLAVARKVVASGGQALLLDINDEAGASAAAELGDAAAYRRTDVTSESEVEAAVAAAVEWMGAVNVAVNCAGVIGAGRVLGREAPMALDFFAKVIQINLVGSFNVCKAAGAAMEANAPDEDGGRGVIISTASVAAYEGQIGQAAYSASKAGIVGMTLPIAREFTRIGVRVMAIAPGIFHTPMVDGMPDHIQDALAASIPFPSRLGQPEEFADLVAHIVENGYFNGETIRLDGAVRLQPK